MKRFLLLLLTAWTLSGSAQPLRQRIVSNDPAKYRLLSAVHAGAGQMEFTELIGRNALSTNLLYLHAGRIHAKSGIGHHFHHTIEEMYVLLNGEAEFTVNGHTSRLKAPAVVPCKMGDAHAIYNPSGETLRWLNFGISTTKGRGDAFDLGDNRVGASLDKIPVFVSGQLKRDALKSTVQPYGGDSILYRRLLGPEIFSTNWDHVDHVVIPAGHSAGPRKMDGFEEVYYVMKGSGSLTVNNESAPFKGDDAFPGLLGESIKLTNDGKEDLELLVIGIATSATKKAVAAVKPKAMVLQMDFVVLKENSQAFEQMYQTVYVPAMSVQQGYLESKMLRLFPETISHDIEAEPTTYNYQIQISFDTEENRRRWVASDQHKIAWPAATKLAKEFKWRGYDVMGEDDRR